MRSLTRPLSLLFAAALVAPPASAPRAAPVPVCRYCLACSNCDGSVAVSENATATATINSFTLHLNLLAKAATTPTRARLRIRAASPNAVGAYPEVLVDLGGTTSSAFASPVATAWKIASGTPAPNTVAVQVAALGPFAQASAWSASKPPIVTVTVDLRGESANLPLTVLRTQ